MDLVQRFAGKDIDGEEEETPAPPPPRRDQHVIEYDLDSDEEDDDDDDDDDERIANNNVAVHPCPSSTSSPSRPPPSSSSNAAMAPSGSPHTSSGLGQVSAMLAATPIHSSASANRKVSSSSSSHSPSSSPHPMTSAAAGFSSDEDAPPTVSVHVAASSTPTTLTSSAAAVMNTAGRVGASGSFSIPRHVRAAAAAGAPVDMRRWVVEKANRYGLHERRIVVLDSRSHAIRFFEQEKLKAEIPLNQIRCVTHRRLSTSSGGDEPTKVVEMHFWEARRSYELFFKHPHEAMEFTKALTEAIAASRAGSLSVQRNSATHPTPRSSHTGSSIHHPSASGHGHGHGSSSKSRFAQFTTLTPTAARQLFGNNGGGGGGGGASSSGSSAHGGGSGDLNQSVAIHSELTEPSLAAPSHLSMDDPSAIDSAEHNAYLDYSVLKRNKYGMKQSRILVLNSIHRSMLLLDDKRKFKKEFLLPSIVGIEIPRSNDGSLSTQAFLIFHPDIGQKPFHLFFCDALDRVHFVERIRALSSHELAIKDESEPASADPSADQRFGIVKVNKAGVKKKRVLVLKRTEKIMRSFNQAKLYKDVACSRILKVEKPLMDRCRLNIFLQQRPHPIILLFPDPVVREKFAATLQEIRESIEQEEMEEEGKKKSSSHSPPHKSPTASSSSPSSSSSSSTRNPSTLSIWLGTWNLGNAPYTFENLDEFIPPHSNHDLYVLGLQECSKGHRDMWLSELRAQIEGTTGRNGGAKQGSGSNGGNGSGSAAGTGAGTSSNNSNNDGNGTNHNPTPSSSRSGSSINTGNLTSRGSISSEEDRTSSSPSNSNSPYVLLGVVKLWEIIMMVLIRRPLARHVSNLMMDTCATGVGDVLGNKGGCGLSFMYEETHLAFVACHLAARAERMTQRAENYQKIIKNLRLGCQPDVDLLTQMDHVFWLGDLNYRNELEFNQTVELVRQRDFAQLSTYDQLTSAMSRQTVLCGFKEGVLEFAPTYRWERRSNVFSNKKSQAPSWTDRVLWHCKTGLETAVELKSYGSAPNVFGSDHRPVYATFTVHVRKAYDGRLPQRKDQLQPIRLMTSHEQDAGAAHDAYASSNVQVHPHRTAAHAPNSFTPSPHSASSSSSSIISPSGSPVSPSSYIPGASVGGANMLSHSIRQGGINSTLPSGAYPAAASSSSAAAMQTSKGFTPYFFQRPRPGWLYTPPLPPPELLRGGSLPAPALGATKAFCIVLNQVKVTLSSLPRGEISLTLCAPFLAQFPTTPPVPYISPDVDEFGYHWDEIPLHDVFIRDLYALYTRHLNLILTIPSSGVSGASSGGAGQPGSDQPSTSGAGGSGLASNGTPIGSSSVSLGTVCSNLFNLVQARQEELRSRGAIHQAMHTHAHTPGIFKGDVGEYYFVEPITREGLYAGQIEGRILFRYR